MDEYKNTNCTYVMYKRPMTDRRTQNEMAKRYCMQIEIKRKLK